MQTAHVNRDGKFIVAPLTTELQRLGAAREKADVWVLVSLRDDAPVNIKGLEQMLAGWAKGGASRAYVLVNCLSDGEPETTMASGADWASIRPVLLRHGPMIQCAIRYIAREAGLTETIVRVCANMGAETDWQVTATDFETHADADLLAEESAIGDDRVKVYPVRTALSRFCHLGAEYVIQVVPPLEEVSLEDAEDMLDAAKQYLFVLRPDNKVYASFCWTASPGSEAGLNDVEVEEYRQRTKQILTMFHEHFVRRKPHGLKVGPCFNYEW